VNPVSQGISSLRSAMLARHLSGRGLLDETWTEVFASVPRDLFLASFYRPAGDSWEHITSETAGEERRLQLAYSDVTWVQRLSGPRSIPGIPASSCIQPSLAARMLTALAARPGDRVLEIGAGTGWLTALLSRRCGTSNVTAVELDPELITQSRATLAELGCAPSLICADGFNGHPPHAPYDHVLSTASVTRIPEPWISQTRPGGRIVTPLLGAIAVIDIEDQCRATGRVLPDVAQVLPLRSAQQRPPDDLGTELAPTSGAAAAAVALRDDRFRFVLALSHPSLKIDDHSLLGELLVTDERGSCVQVSPLGNVRATGTRDIWGAVTRACEWWEFARHPGPSDFLIDLNTTGQWVKFTGSTPVRSWHLR
jgi:protein-L-isoaspartate O-methyltransferase